MDDQFEEKENERMHAKVKLTAKMIQTEHRQKQITN